MPATHLLAVTFSGTGDHQAAGEATVAMLQQLTSLGAPSSPENRAQLNEVPLSNDFVVVQPFSFEPEPGEGRSTLQSMIRTSSDDKLEEAKVRVTAGLESLALANLAHEVAYLERTAPGAMYWLGVANPEKGIVGMPQSPDFTVDEEAIFVGARSMSAVLLRYLEMHAQQGS